MLSKKQLETKLKNHPSVKPRLATLRLAEQINPDFKNPHVVGGYLRNIILNREPNDCDVCFEGHQLNQPNILEAVRGAEKRLKIPPCPYWEFENISATGYSGDLYEDIVGKYSFHTDYLTMVMMSSLGKLFIGEEKKTLNDFSKRIYDLRFAGVDLWADFRGNGRCYESCLSGDLIRGLYLCQSLDLQPSEIASLLLTNFDGIFNHLEPADQEARRSFWRRKTKGNGFYQPILDRFNIKTLTTY